MMKGPDMLKILNISEFEECKSEVDLVKTNPEEGQSPSADASLVQQNDEEDSDYYSQDEVVTNLTEEHFKQIRL